MTAQEYLDHLRTEYGATADRSKAVWQTVGTTITLAVSGVFIALILAVEKYPTSGPVFLVLPFILVGWYVMMDLQTEELYWRGKYLGLLEEDIRKLTGEPFPCGESKLQHVLYGSWRFTLLSPLVGLPVALIYVFTTKKALDYLLTISPLYFIVGVASLTACPLLAALLTFLNGRALDNELNEVRALLGEHGKNVQQSLQAIAGSAA